MADVIVTVDLMWCEDVYLLCVLQHVRTQRDAALQSQSIHEFTGRP